MNIDFPKNKPKVLKNQTNSDIFIYDERNTQP